MALFDDQPDDQQNDSAEERDRKLFRLITGSRSPLPSYGGAPDASPSAPPSDSGEFFGRPVAPLVPSARNVPLAVPTVEPPGGPSTPPFLGAGSVRPARPDVQPQRADFQPKPELSGFKKVLGLGAGFALGSAPLVDYTLRGQQEIANRKFQQASKEWEQEQADKYRAAQTEHLSAEAQALRNPKPEKPENLDREAYDFYVQGGMTPAEARRQVLKDAAEVKPEKPDTETEEAQRYEKIDTAQRLKKPVSPEDLAWKQSYEKRKTLAPALTAGAKAGEQGTQRSDRSYQFISSRIDALRKPVEDRAERIARLSDTLAQGTPQADALVAPELLSVMAGGAGSGLRMNEAEIARIVGGRTNWETLKAKVNAWQLDPNKGFALTPAQRQQVNALFGSVKDRASRKMQAFDASSQQLLDTDDPKDQRRIYQQLQKTLGGIDTGGGQATGGGSVRFTEGGRVWNIPPDQVADFQKDHPNAQR